MKYYVAPMEGITNYTWRKVHRQCFLGADKYYTPFMVATSDHNFQPKELNDILHEEKDIVPQILTNQAEYFVWAAKDLFSRGFDEVNLNMGCPSGTVVAKHKGSGMLRDTIELRQTLDIIFDTFLDKKISIKARIGLIDIEEWHRIYEVMKDYPIYELTVHPRVQKEGYKGLAHRDVFDEIVKIYNRPLVYNGDLYTLTDIRQFEIEHPTVNGIMFGRGILRNPSLIRQAQGGEKAAREELINYHQKLIEEYQKTYTWDNATICHMKEFWTYFKNSFEDTDKLIKGLLKSKRMEEFLSYTDTILGQCALK